MKWIRERDALIAQTLAFVQSVTGKKDEPRRPDAAAPPGPIVQTATILAVEQALEIEPPPAPPQPFQVAPPRTAGDFRNEVQARVASFRKHQERFEREREEYCATTLARLRAAIRDTAPSRPPAGK